MTKYSLLSGEVEKCFDSFFCRLLGEKADQTVVLQQRTDNRSRWIRPKISVIGLW